MNNFEFINNRLMDIAYCLPQIRAITVHGPSTQSQPKTNSIFTDASG